MRWAAPSAFSREGQGAPPSPCAQDHARWWVGWRSGWLRDSKAEHSLHNRNLKADHILCSLRHRKRLQERVHLGKGLSDSGGRRWQIPPFLLVRTPRHLNQTCISTSSRCAGKSAGRRVALGREDGPWRASGTDAVRWALVASPRGHSLLPQQCQDTLLFSWSWHCGVVVGALETRGSLDPSCLLVLSDSRVMETLRLTAEPRGCWREPAALSGLRRLETPTALCSG